MEEINLVEYGKLCQKVDNVSEKMISLEKTIMELKSLIDKSKGGFWVAIGSISLISSAVGGLTSWLFGK